ncbi:MAG: hypothetical protein WB780_18405 [Candidatus Acidiferrales bacterium]
MIRYLGLKSLLVSMQALCLLAALPANAQSAASTSAVVASPSELGPVYDVSKEIKIQGNVLKVGAVSGNAGLLGTHAQIQTPQGVVDAHLGSGHIATAQTLGLYPGQSVTLTGMMATVGGNSVFLVRTLTTSSHVFILRNEHGIPTRSLLPRGGASTANAVKGGL